MVGRAFSSVRSLAGAGEYILKQIKATNFHVYYASNAVPASVRTSYLALHQLLFELGGIMETTQQKTIAQAKLDFWKSTVQSIYNKTEPEPEPLSLLLQQAVNNNPLTQVYFDRIFSSWEQVFEGFGSLPAMADLCERIWTNHFMLVHELLRQDVLHPDLVRATELVGRATGIAFFLKRLPFTLRQGWLVVPDTLQEKHGFTVKTVVERGKGIPRDELYDAVLEMAAFARETLRQAQPIAMPGRSYTTLLTGVETQYFLEQLQKYDFNVFQKGLHRPSLWTLPTRMRSLNKKGLFLEAFKE
jgi:NADH dehydrogenase [ubiquinone] 1 alpha subcomplex assembly factor 6